MNTLGAGYSDWRNMEVFSNVSTSVPKWIVLLHIWPFPRVRCTPLPNVFFCFFCFFVFFGGATKIKIVGYRIPRTNWKDDNRPADKGNCQFVQDNLQHFAGMSKQQFYGAELFNAKLASLADLFVSRCNEHYSSSWFILQDTEYSF